VNVTSPVPPNVTGASFRQAVAPALDVIRELVLAVEAAGLRHGGIASATSKAMDEIASEQAWAKRSDWENPASDTHSIGGITLAAASDYARSFAQALDTDETPVYGHLVVARTALETSVISAWLNSPTVDVAERIRRGLCEQLYSAMELKRLKIDPDANERIARWKATTTTLGWSFTESNGKPVVEQTKRPSIPQGIDQLVVGDGEGSAGRFEWSYLSAVSHGVWYGLQPALFEPVGTDRSGFATVSYGTTSDSVVTHALCGFRALRGAATSRLILMGWQDAEWDEARRAAEAHELALLGAKRPT